MFYNSRYYDSSLGRFASPDTIVPGGVQGLDRYAYVNNSPINFVDPSGHLSCYGDNFDDGPQCLKKNPTAYNPRTLDDFRNMTWRNRKDWLMSLVHKNGLGDWFNDIESAIDFMTSDPHFSQKGSTTEVMDAAVLQAINDGWLMYEGKELPAGEGGQGWADFFNLLDPLGLHPEKSPASQMQLNIARLSAEQYGVTYSFGLSDVQTAYSNSDAFDQIYFDDFKWAADNYRATGIDGSGFGGVVCPLCAGRIDPRVWGGPLSFGSHFLAPLSWMKFGVLQMTQHPAIFP